MRSLEVPVLHLVCRHQHRFPEVADLGQKKFQLAGIASYLGGKSRRLLLSARHGTPELLIVQMLFSDTIWPLLGCTFFPFSFVFGFVCAKYLSMRIARVKQRIAYVGILVIIEALLYKTSALHFWISVIFTLLGFRMLVPGLTGGVASGKTTVASYLKSRGWYVIDADEISRNILKRGTPAFRQVVNAFGDGIIEKKSGEIDRASLRQVIFNDSSKRRQLNRITHPWIIATIAWRLLVLRICLWRQRVILDIPLLIETRLHLFCGPVVVVYVPEELQLRRLLARDRAAPEQTLRSMVCSQLPLKEKLLLADIVLDNSLTLQDLFKEIDKHFPH